MPTLDDYTRMLKTHAVPLAKRHRRFFEWSAYVIVTAHLLATVLAVIAMMTHEVAVLKVVLSLELLLIAGGVTVHEWVHRSHRLRRWVATRAVRELVRSAGYFKGLQTTLGHLSTVPYPASIGLRALARTLNVLHLRDGSQVAPAGNGSSAPWQIARDRYVDVRLCGPKPEGQIAYYRSESKRAGLIRVAAQGLFLLFSVMAFLFSWLKLEAAITSHGHDTSLLALFGALAIILPAAAVAALSIAAALDLAARKQTYADMVTALEQIAAVLADAPSERECIRLILDAEARILGENANWASRRAFTGNP